MVLQSRLTSVRHWRQEDDRWWETLAEPKADTELSEMLCLMLSKHVQKKYFRQLQAQP